MYDVIEIIKHPKYNKAVPDDFDVALLRIKEPISFTPCTVTPVKLIQSGKEVPKGTTLSVTGWGATKASVISFYIKFHIIYHVVSSILP